METPNIPDSPAALFARDDEAKAEMQGETTSLAALEKKITRRSKSLGEALTQAMQRAMQEWVEDDDAKDDAIPAYYGGALMSAATYATCWALVRNIRSLADKGENGEATQADRKEREQFAGELAVNIVASIGAAVAHALNHEHGPECQDDH